MFVSFSSQFVSIIVFINELLNRFRLTLIVVFYSYLIIPHSKSIKTAAIIQIVHPIVNGVSVGTSSANGSDHYLPRVGIETLNIILGE